MKEKNKKVGRPSTGNAKIQKSIRLERDIIDWMVLEFGSVQKGVEKMAKKELAEKKALRSLNHEKSTIHT